MERFGTYTWIECRLETGRTHQIRVHMASIGHPLVGDPVYGPAKCPYSFSKGADPPCLYTRDLFIRGQENTWNSQRRCRIISRDCWIFCGQHISVGFTVPGRNEKIKREHPLIVYD